MAVVVLPLLFGLSSCKKEDPLHPVWMTYSAQETGLVDQREFNICSDVSGNVYAVQSTDTEDVFKLSYHSKGTEAWKTIEFSFVPQHYLYVTDENHMKATTDGSVYLLGKEEMLRFKDGEIIQRYTLSHLLAQGSEVGVTRFATYGTEVWLLHWNYGLFQLNTETGATLSFQDPGYSGSNALLSIDNEGNKWITKSNYQHNIIALRSDGTWQTATDPDSLLGCPECAAWGGLTYQDFRAMASDGFGNTYLFTTDYGLFRLKDGIVQYMALGFGFLFDGMTLDHDNRLWFYKTWYPSTPPESALYIYNGGSAPTIIELTEMLPGNVWPYDLTFDHNNNAWVATNMGITVYNENGVEF